MSFQDTNLDAMHTTIMQQRILLPCGRKRERARYETHYSLMVSALIRIHSLCVASPGFHISIHASRRLPLLRCCDVSQSVSPTICTIQPQHLYSSAGSRTCSIVELCFSSLCTVRSSSECHDDVKKSATPWLAVCRVSICV